MCGFYLRIVYQLQFVKYRLCRAGKKSPIKDRAKKQSEGGLQKPIRRQGGKLKSRRCQMS